MKMLSSLLFAAASRRPPSRISSSSRLLATTASVSSVDYLIRELRKLDTACLCDADKTILANKGTDPYEGIRLLSSSIRRINSPKKTSIMVGVAFTVQCKHNDFLAVLRGLMEAQEGDVLIVDTAKSDRAVAGELFATQASQKQLSGIIVDGPVRDTEQLQDLATPVYAASVTPYSGTIQAPGKIQLSIQCGDVQVNPGDLVVGDCDGVVIGSTDTYGQLLQTAQAIAKTESTVRERLLNGTGDLAMMTNYREHVAARSGDKVSNLEFRA